MCARFQFVDIDDETALLMIRDPKLKAVLITVQNNNEGWVDNCQPLVIPVSTIKAAP